VPAANAKLAPTSVIAIVGAGTMGAGIAQVAALAGHPVLLYDVRSNAAQKAITAIDAELQKLAKRGVVPQESANAAQRIRAASSLEDLGDATLVLEAVVENLALKQELFAQLAKVVAPDCILATNTSSFSITDLAVKLAHPERVVGMHFFNPATRMPLVEVVSGSQTSPAIATAVAQLARAWGKVSVLASSMPGFIVNRIARPFYAEAWRLLAEQAGSPATLDAIMRESGGFRMGPFELMDLIGHDVNSAVTQSVFEGFGDDPRFETSPAQIELVKAGKLGKKSGQGIYSYALDAPANEIATEPPAATPPAIEIHGSDAMTDALKHRLASTGVKISQLPAAGDAPFVKVGLVSVTLTDGRTAEERGRATGTRNLVLVDLALDFETAKRVALARSAKTPDADYKQVVGLFRGAGFAVSPIRDAAGMAVMRTVAMLADEAFSAVQDGLCSEADADTAMVKGVNYPLGPIAWARKIGLAKIVTVLENLQAHYHGDRRYRVANLLLEQAKAGPQR
jgi:3-hydroxybutyryl-CoA dehydrogenase